MTDDRDATGGSLRDDEELHRVVGFHGHVCPGLAYGVRVARAALRELGPRAGDEELLAVVENDSCSVDAIQVLTGCTFGKGNLIFRDHGKSVYTFVKRGTGQGIRIVVDYQQTETPDDVEVWRRFRGGDRSDEVVRGIAERKTRKVRDILSAPEEAVLSLDWTEIPVPPRASIYPSLRCAACGEKVMEPRVRVRAGKSLCLPCFNAE